MKNSYWKTMQVVTSSCVLVSLASACGTPSKTDSRSGSVKALASDNLQDCYVTGAAAKLVDTTKGAPYSNNNGNSNSYGNANTNDNSYGYGGKGGGVNVAINIDFSIGGFLHSLFHLGGRGNSYGNSGSSYNNSNGSYNNGSSYNNSGSYNNNSSSYNSTSTGTYTSSNNGSYTNTTGQGGQCSNEGNNSYGNGGKGGINVVVNQPGGTGVEPPPPGATPVPVQPGQNPCTPTQTPTQTPVYTPVAPVKGASGYGYPTAIAANSGACGQNGIYCDDGAAGQWPAQTVGGATYDQTVVQGCFQAFRASGYNTKGQWGIDVRTYADAAALAASGIQDAGTAQLMVVIDAVDIASATQFNLLDSHALYCVQGMNTQTNVTINSCFNGNVAFGSPAALLSSGIAVQGCSN